MNPDCHAHELVSHFDPSPRPSSTKKNRPFSYPYKPLQTPYGTLIFFRSTFVFPKTRDIIFPLRGERPLRLSLQRHTGSPPRNLTPRLGTFRFRSFEFCFRISCFGFRVSSPSHIGSDHDDAPQPNPHPPSPRTPTASPSSPAHPHPPSTKKNRPFPYPYGPPKKPLRHPNFFSPHLRSPKPRDIIFPSRARGPTAPSPPAPYRNHHPRNLTPVWNISLSVI